MNKIRIAGAAAGVVLVSGVVLQVSSAAFESETRNDGNSWDAGTVYLDSTAGVMFSATGIKPGYSETKCITVTYTGSLDPSAVTLHADVTETDDDATRLDGSDGLADDLSLQVKVGVAGTTCATATFGVIAADYTGTLAGFNDSTARRPTGWVPDADALTAQTIPFEFTVGLPTAAVDNAQGDGATADFVWTASS